MECTYNTIVAIGSPHFTLNEPSPIPAAWNGNRGVSIGKCVNRFLSGGDWGGVDRIVGTDRRCCRFRRMR